jgi:hypothetical protein
MNLCREGNVTSVDGAYDMIGKKTIVLHGPVSNVRHSTPEVSVMSKDLAGLQQLWLKGSSPHPHEHRITVRLCPLVACHV